jgi:hypothetical protein
VIDHRAFERLVDQLVLMLVLLMLGELLADPSAESAEQLLLLVQLAQPDRPAA